ncbi:MAG: hypothetical protein ACO1QS_06215 [Verrucomicrobiota bacterium]
MKASIHYSCLGLALLVAGCASEETDSFVLKPATETAAMTVPVPVEVSLVPSSPAAQPYAATASAASAAGETAPVETDAERRTELADYTEKVYLRWNAALTDYRQKQNRWPGSLHDLQQHQPELAAMQPPRGFALKLDPQAGEILVTRASQTRPATGALPPPLAIR